MNALQNLDTELFLYLNTALESSIFNLMMPIITHLGDKWLLWPELALVTLLCRPQAFKLETKGEHLNAVTRSRLQLFLLLALIYGITAGLYASVKAAADRDRQFEKSVGELRVSGETAESIRANGSFPSGHTANAFMLATMLSVALPRLTLALFSGASLVGFSRIYLGVHYPLDVLF